MKKKVFQIRTSPEDEAILQKAAEKFEKLTGKKGMVSRAILQAVQEYVNNDQPAVNSSIKTAT